MNPARIAAFKSKTVALIDTLHLNPMEVVGLGLTLAVAYGIVGGAGAADLHKALDDALATAGVKPQTGGEE